MTELTHRDIICTLIFSCIDETEEGPDSTNHALLVSLGFGKTQSVYT